MLSLIRGVRLGSYLIALYSLHTIMSDGAKLSTSSVTFAIIQKYIETVRRIQIVLRPLVDLILQKYLLEAALTFMKSLPSKEGLNDWVTLPDDT